MLFDVPSMADYGKLSAPLAGRDDRRRAGRGGALQEETPPISCCGSRRSRAQPGWDSPWGRGRPGWHIECSAMAWKHLGETFDIHGGGHRPDLPASRERDRAEPNAPMTARRWRNVWMHNGFLQVDGEKMSKSPRQLLHRARAAGRGPSRRGDPLALLMTAHYRQPLDISREAREGGEGAARPLLHRPGQGPRHRAGDR